MLAIFSRELRSYFNNVIGFVVIAVLLFFSGIFATALNLRGLSADFEYTLSSLMIILIFIIPLLTMRSLTEDKRNKTDLLLSSLPLKSSQVIIGKYLAMVVVFAIPTLIMCIYPIIISAFGIMYYEAIYTSIFGFFLLSCALMAICMFLSTLTDSQVVAAVTSIGTLLLLYLSTSVTQIIPESPASSFLGLCAVAILLSVAVYLLVKNLNIAILTCAVLIIPLCLFYVFIKDSFTGLFAKIILKLALFDRFEYFVGGIFDISAIVYYLSIIAFFVFLSIRSMEKHRFN